MSTVALMPIKRVEYLALIAKQRNKNKTLAFTVALMPIRKKGEVPCRNSVIM